MTRQAKPSESGLTLAIPMEQTTLTPSRCFVRDLADGQEVNEVFVVRAHTQAPAAQRRAVPEAPARRYHGRRRGRDLGRGRGAGPDLPDRLGGAHPRPLFGRRALRRCGHGQADAGRGRGRVRAGGPHRGARSARTRRWPPTSRRWSRRSSGRTCERCSARLIDRSTETGAAYHSAPAAKYYHQAYRHGLLEHCLSVAQGVSALAARTVPRRGRPRPGRNRRAPARHREDRGLLDRQRRDRARPTAASCSARSRSATTWCAARSSGSTAFRPPRPRASFTSS